MGRFAAWLAVLTLIGSGQSAVAQEGPVHLAAEKFSTGIQWNEATVLTGDFTCAGKLEFAILRASPTQIVVAIFPRGLDQAPELLRFEANERNAKASKIRLDDNTMTATEIAGLSGEMPAGYRPSATCHGVRLSDDRVDAAHIYWDHEHQHFDSWVQ